MSNRASKGRTLPSWMSEDNQTRKSTGPTASTSATDFSCLLEGVVFVLSGFVNPERAALRSQALEMGAEYRPDWSSDCTLLVCAYSNTPKFRQVESDCGTIVKKDWILECYKQKKLVEIDSYLMHVGRPWRKSNTITKSDVKASPPTKSEKQVERGPRAKPTTSSSSKQTEASSPVNEYFSPSKVKKWAIDDLNRAITWLESQEEKPEPSEIKQIAAEGIIICLQDAIDFLEQNQDVRQVTQQWNVVPHAVEELIKLVDDPNYSAPHSKENLCKQAKTCKEMYEAELKNVNDDSKAKKKKLKTEETDRAGNRSTDDTSKNSAVYDSDETIEMTEEEINYAYNAVASKLCK